MWRNNFGGARTYFETTLAQAKSQMHINAKGSDRHDKDTGRGDNKKDARKDVKKKHLILCRKSTLEWRAIAEDRSN